VDVPDQLLRGLAVGFATATIVGVLVVALRSRRPRPVALAGVAGSAAALVAMSFDRSIPVGLVVGIVGVAVVCGLPVLRNSATAMALLAAPCAWLVAVDASPTAWIRLVVLATATIGAVAVSRGETAWADVGVTPLLFAGAAAGAYLAVPDTEEAAAMLGAVAPLALLGWPVRGVTLGRGGAASLVTLFAWVVAIGGRGRTPSIIGGLACLGVLVWLAAAPRVRTWLRWPRHNARIGGSPQVLGLIAADAAIVVVASRVAGVSADLGFAIVVAAATAILALVVVVLVGAPDPPPEPSV
jgi:hypothetical protein